LTFDPQEGLGYKFTSIWSLPDSGKNVKGFTKLAALLMLLAFFGLLIPNPNFDIFFQVNVTDITSPVKQSGALFIFEATIILAFNTVIFLLVFITNLYNPLEKWRDSK
jgi:hypothetical protein